MITLRRRQIVLGLAVLPAAARAQAAPLPVVASFSILADLVRQVGGDTVSVAALVPPDADPHTFQPRPGDLRAMRGASVMVENGLGLEGWLSRLVGASGFRGIRVVAASDVRPRQMQEGGRNATDPHVWQDPRNAVLMVRAIAEGLAKADPARAPEFHSRADAYGAEILRVDAEIAGQLAAIPAAKRQIITSHDAFAYYGARYGVTFRGVQGIDTESEPSPRDLARLAEQIRREGIKAVFVENMTDPRIAQALAREAGAVVGGKVYSDSLSPPGGPATTYLDMLRYNTAQFVAAMR